LQALADLRDLAVTNDEYRDAIYAEESRGKASGHYRIDIRAQHKLTPELLKSIDFDALSDDELDAIRAGNIMEALFARLVASAHRAAN